MEWLQLNLRLAEPDFCSRLGTEHPTVSIVRWVSEGEGRSFEIWEFLCGEPIAMRHLKQSLSKFEERGELEILSIQLAYNDVITALVKTHARQDRTTRPDPLWVMEDYSSFVMMPVTYEGSLAHFRIVAMDETEIPRMIGKLEKAGRVEVLSRIPLKTIPVEQYSLFSPREIFSGLTDKQAHSLLTALELDYFTIPRRRKFEEISRITGTPRTTFETHVRKAEYRILNSLAPYLLAYFGKPRSVVRRPSKSSHLTAEISNASPNMVKGDSAMTERATSNDLFEAIKEGETPKVKKMVIRNPGLLSVSTPEGMSPVVVSMYYGKPKIAELLISQGAKLNLFEAAMTGRTSDIKEILSQDVSKVNSFSADGFTALHFASFFGQLEAARYLIEKGADVNAVANNTMKVRPLHSAVAHDHVEISALLLEHGASVNARQEGGFAPIHAAAQNGSIRMTKLLLDNGADLNPKTAEGKTPLAIAAEDGAEAGPKAKRQALRRFLVQKGAA